MQLHIDFIKHRLHIRVKTIMKKHKDMIHMRARVAQRGAEIAFAQAVSCEVFNQKQALACIQLSSICALRPNPLGFLRTYCIGSIKRSASQAAYGMPAVSPPAIASICSKPISDKMTASAISIKARRARTNEMILRQSI